MSKKNWLLLLISIACFNAYADQDDVVIVNNASPSTAVVSSNNNSNTTTTANNSVISTPNTLLGVANEDVKKNAPADYTVKKNDTVSRIATMYLKKIGLWPQFLGVSNLADTKLYPGDKLRIISADGNRKILVVSIGGGRDNYYQKLSPTIRYDSLDSSPPIEFAKIKNMLINPIVMKKESYEALPMVVGSSNPRVVYYSMGDNIYVKNYVGKVGDTVMVLGHFRDLVDPDSKEKLGVEYRYEATGVMTSVGKISNMEPLSVNYQMASLDRIAPANDLIPSEIVPHRSDYLIDGKIIGLYDSFTTTGENNTVVINRGSRDGVQLGTVFTINDGHVFLDPTSSDDDHKYLQAPEQIIGELLVYKVYDKVAFALVTDSTQEIPLYAKIMSE